MNDQTLEQFLAACGSEGPLRLGVGLRTAMELSVQSFSKPFLVIGRSSDSDLVLDHWQVSRRHAYLQLIEGRYYCSDLGSRTGTHGGDAAKRSGWLEPGRVIQIGPFAVRPEPPTTEPGPPRRAPGLTWELPSTALGQATWKMDRYMAMVGRSPACKIRFLEPDVSKFHCSLVLTPYGVWAIDLLGEHGVFVNDEKIRCARVLDGDELRVGSHVIRARYDHSPLPLPALKSASADSGSPTELLPDLIPASQFPMSTPTRIELPARITMPPLPTGTDLANMIEQAGGGAIDPSVNLLVHQFGMMQQNMLDQFHNTMMMMFEGFAALHREQAGTIREEFEQVRKLTTEIEALRAETARLAKEATARPPQSRLNPGPAPANGHTAPRPFIPKPQPAASESEGDVHAQLYMKLSSIETERQNRWQKILGMMGKS